LPNMAESLPNMAENSGVRVPRSPADPLELVGFDGGKKVRK